MADNHDAEQIRDLCRFLFHEHFCPECEIQPDKKAFVLPAYFYGWLHKFMDFQPGDDICEAAKVSPAYWDMLKEIVDAGLAPERLAGLWFEVALGDRPKPKQRLRCVSFALMLTWEDGRIFPVQVFVNEQTQAQAAGIDDAMVATLITRHLQTFVQDILEKGLDGIHQGAADYRGTTPEDPFAIFMGANLQILPQLQAEYRKPVEAYLRLAQGLIRPVHKDNRPSGAIPPQHPPPPAPERPVRGGWDT